MKCKNICEDEYCKYFSYGPKGCRLGFFPDENGYCKFVVYDLFDERVNEYVIRAVKMAREYDRKMKEQ